MDTMDIMDNFLPTYETQWTIYQHKDVIYGYTQDLNSAGSNTLWVRSPPGLLISRNLGNTGVKTVTFGAFAATHNIAVDAVSPSLYQRFVAAGTVC